MISRKHDDRCFKAYLSEAALSGAALLYARKRLMAKDFAKAFYASRQWQQCRDGYIKSINGLCERHLEQGKYEPGFIVHHKIELTPENINNPEITLSWSNLEYLCADCHNKEHHGSKEGSTQEGLIFNNKGELVQGEAV